MFQPLSGRGLSVAIVTAFAFILPLLSASEAIHAQDTPYNNIPASTSESFILHDTLLESLMQESPFTGIESKPVGGTFRSGFEPFTLDPIEQFGVACENLTVIFADPVTHQFLPVETGCDETTVTVRSFGPGAYLFFDQAHAVFPFHFTSPRRILTNVDL